MILCAYELDRRLRRAGKSIASIAFDPGSIPDTGLLRDLPGPLQTLSKSSFARWLARRMGITQGRLDFSGASLAKVAADPDFAQMSGRYLQSHDGSLRVARSSKASYDADRAKQLWEDSERLANTDRSRAVSPSRHPPISA